MDYYRLLPISLRFVLGVDFIVKDIYTMFTQVSSPACIILLRCYQLQEISISGFLFPLHLS